MMCNNLSESLQNKTVLVFGFSGSAEQNGRKKRIENGGSESQTFSAFLFLASEDWMDPQHFQKLLV